MEDRSSLNVLVYLAGTKSKEHLKNKEQMDQKLKHSFICNHSAWVSMYKRWLDDFG